jgi:outer membrane immunogenic protein
MLMKKQLRFSIISTAALLAASTVSFAGANYKGENYKGEAMAAPCPTPLMIKDGFYLGAQVGYDSYRVRQNVTLTDGIDSLSSNPVLNPAGFVGGIFGGYGQYFDMYYLGGEIFVNGSGAETSYTTTATAGGVTDSAYSKVSVGTSYGISLLPGVKLNDASLLYVRLGWNRAQIKGQSSLTTATGTYSTSNNNWSNGFNYGLGVESAFYQNWSARLEYTHTNYNSFSSGGSSFSPSDNQAMLGLIYHFA